MNRQQPLSKLLQELNFFYNVLNSLIIEYDTTVQFLGQKLDQIHVDSSWKMANNEKYLCVCKFYSNTVTRYDANTLYVVDEITLSNHAASLDICDNELYIYVRDVALNVYDLETKEMKRQWTTEAWAYGIKVFEKKVYYLGYDGKIYIYDHLTGDILHSFGKSGNKIEEFLTPRGIDIDDHKFIFVADYGNHRIQVFFLKIIILVILGVMMVLKMENLDILVKYVYMKDYVILEIIMVFKFLHKWENFYHVSVVSIKTMRINLVM